MEQLRLYPLGGQAIFQYFAGRQATMPILNSDVGGHHVAL